MVLLEEIPDEHFRDSKVQSTEEEDDFTDTDSEISTDSNFDPTHESLLERLYALRMIVPPATRRSLSSKFSTTYNAVSSTLLFSAQALWVVSAGAMLVGVPFAMCYAEEQMIMTQEQELMMREAGGELLTAGGGGEGDTLEKLGAALGEDKAGAKASL